MIKKLHFEPRYEAELKDGRLIKFPDGFRNEDIKAKPFKQTVILTHPSHPPITLKPHGWVEIHPDLKDIRPYRLIARENGTYEIYGDMKGPFATVAWFALGRNPNFKGISR